MYSYKTRAQLQPLAERPEEAAATATGPEKLRQHQHTPRRRRRNTSRRERRRNTSRSWRNTHTPRIRKHRSLMILDFGAGGQCTNTRAAGGRVGHAEAILASHQQKGTSRWRYARLRPCSEQKGTSRWRYARLRPCSAWLRAQSIQPGSACLAHGMPTAVLSHQRIPHRGRRRGLSHQRIPHIPQRLPQAFGLAIRTNWTSKGRLWLAGGFTRSIRCGRRGHGQDPCQNFFMKEAISVGSGEQHGMKI